jgi:hypothetical protein
VKHFVAVSTSYLKEQLQSDLRRKNRTNRSHRESCSNPSKLPDISKCVDDSSLDICSYCRVKAIYEGAEVERYAHQEPLRERMTI